MNKTPWFRPLTVAVLAVALGVVPILASSNVTVGEFLIEIAKVKNLSARDGESAVAALRAAGLRLPALDVRKPLTEGDVVAVATAAGLNVTTTRPDSPFSRSQVTSFIFSFGSDLGKMPGSPPNEPKDGGGGPPRDDPNPDKGKSKGFRKTPSEPE